MNNRGFTLVELLATIIILALVSGISIVGVMASQENAKKKLENNFMNDVGNAIDMYISMNTDSLKFGSNSVGKINKGHGVVNVYVTIKSFDDIVGSGIISRNDLINPVNNNRCDGNIKIYRDDDYVYYYSVSLDDCIKYDVNKKTLTNLPLTYSEDSGSASSSKVSSSSSVINGKV
mgnify:FL=1